MHTVLTWLVPMFLALFLVALAYRRRGRGGPSGPNRPTDNSAGFLGFTDTSGGHHHSTGHQDGGGFGGHHAGGFGGGHHGGGFGGGHHGG